MKRMIVILLLLTLSLSMWGCSSNATDAGPARAYNRHSSTASNQRPNYNSNNSGKNNNNSSAKIDPNGFSSLEQLIDALKAHRTGTLTKEQLRKCYPQYYWDSGASLDETYSYIINDANNSKESIAKQYGTDYKITYAITNSTVVTDYSSESFTESETREFIEVFGVSPKNAYRYRISITITVSGNIKTASSPYTVDVLKVGSKWYAGGINR